MIAIRGPFLDTLLPRESCEFVETWCAKTVLSVNPRETEVIVIKINYKRSKECGLTLHGEGL